MAQKYRYPTYQLRMPPPLKAALEEEANRNGRSLNAEIVHRLEQGLGQSAGGDGQPVAGAEEAVSTGIGLARALLKVLEEGEQAGKRGRKG